MNRGLAIYDGKIFAPVIDGRLQALDPLTGKVLWEARLAYPQEWYSVTMARILVHFGIPAPQLLPGPGIDSETTLQFVMP